MGLINLVLVCLLMALGGCRGVDRLINGPEDTTNQIDRQIETRPPLGAAPEFAVNTPAGYHRVTYYDYLPNRRAVAVADVPDSLLAVFVKDQAGWHKLGSNEVPAYWYSASGNTVTYQGIALAGKEYCIYQYIKGE